MRPSTLALVILAAVPALPACGGGSEDSDSPPVATTSMVTMSERKFAPRHVNAAADEFLAVRNAGSEGHDLKLRREGKEMGGTQVLNPGETQRLEVLFDPGDYEMYCSVPGHEESGMNGTFTVVD